MHIYHAMSSQTRPARTCAMHVFVDVTSYDNQKRPYVTHAYNHLTVTNVIPGRPTIYKDLLTAIDLSVKKLIPSRKSRDVSRGIDSEGDDALANCLCDENGIIEDNNADDRTVEGMDVTNNKIKLDEFEIRVHPETCDALHKKIQALGHESQWTKIRSAWDCTPLQIHGNTSMEFEHSCFREDDIEEDKGSFFVCAGKYAIPLAQNCRDEREKKLPEYLVTSSAALHMAASLYEHDIKITAVCFKGSQFRPLHFIADLNGMVLPLDRPTHTDLCGHANVPLQRFRHHWTKAINMNHMATYKEIAHMRADAKNRRSILTRNGVLVYSPLQDKSQSYLVTFCLGNCKWNTTTGNFEIPAIKGE